MSSQRNHVLVCPTLEQETIHFISEVGNTSGIAASMTLDFVKENHLALHAKVGSWDQIGSVAWLIAESLGSKAEAELRAFFDQLSDFLEESDLDKALQQIRENEEWVGKYMQIVCDWVDDETAQLSTQVE